MNFTETTTTLTLYKQLSHSLYKLYTIERKRNLFQLHLQLLNFHISFTILIPKLISTTQLNTYGFY